MRFFAPLALTMMLAASAGGDARAAGTTQAPTAPAPPSSAKLPDWWNDYQVGGYASLMGTFEEETDGTNVKGLRFSFGPEGKVKNIQGRMDVWLSVRQGGDLDVYGVGFEIAAVPFASRWAGLGFLLDHGIEYRTESPHEGFGGFIGPGMEGVFWLGDHVRLTAGVEHDFGIGTRSRDVFRLSLGFSHRRWPPKIPKGAPVSPP
jgi:hypothetical protein